MKQLYILLLLLFCLQRSEGQSCSALTFSYSVTESRCVATGSIIINATGGSGNYNYKASGPVTPPVTSSNIITGLPPGYYSVYVKDLTSGCTHQVDSIYVPGSYSDPRFQLVKTDAGCAGNNGTISTQNTQYGRSPFTYTIIAPSPSNVGASNTTGNFTGLVPGEYSIQLKDSCGGIQVRSITIENYSWWFDNLTVNRVGCDSVDVSVVLKDNKGNSNTSGTAFNGFTYGAVLAAGDTTWFSARNFRTFIGTNRNFTIVVKDNCGNLHTSVWFMPASAKPSVSLVSTSNFSCTQFTATVTGAQNLTNPSYCLYDAANNQLSCNTNGVFNSLPYGSYCIKVTDNCYDTVITKCFAASHAIPSVGASVTISNTNCSTFTATITSQQNLTTPNICLYDGSGNQIQCNSTGIFNNVPYGSYCIKVKDGCIDTTITRCFTATKPVPVITNVNISGANCSTFNATATGSNLNSPYYCLYDSAGNIVTCDSTGVFNGLTYGRYCVRAISCGDTTASYCFSSVRPVPNVNGSVTINNKTCTGFKATITGQTNLTNPDYCLYTSPGDVLVSCNTTGIFDNIPYGSYCIKIHNTCYDTVIQRCFTQLQAVPGINASMQTVSMACSTVTFKVNGTNLTSPQYCLYDSTNTQVTCNTTGQFSNVPYGPYCVKVHDGCKDTTMTVCQTFRPTRGFSLSTSKSCTIGYANINIVFVNASAPYNVAVYRPDNTKALDTTFSTSNTSLLLPGLPTGAKYKVVGTDNCGNKDSLNITPDASIVQTTTAVRAKCPSSTWANGSGDIQASSTSNLNPLIPQIIKKSGTAFAKSYSSYNSGTGVYTFSDLEPADYIVEYTMQTCNTKKWDTITVPPYAYPSQGQSAIYQCDNNSFSLGADVQGGVSPYSYQIIGSVPESPSITTVPQTSAVFNINTGTVYSLIRLRSVDACGNATLNDVSVLPLQNLSVTASGSCFYQNITLAVDTIKNASYQWYRKTTTTDSSLVGSSIAFNLPYFVPEQMGQYVCKVNVNQGCVTRLAYFNLMDNCGYTYLATKVSLQGAPAREGIKLNWNIPDGEGVGSYSIERRTEQGNAYTVVGNVTANTATFTDLHPDAGSNFYRIKILYQDSYVYSNEIRVDWLRRSIAVYPNPANDQLHITVSADQNSNYKIELLNAGGQMIYTTSLKNTRAATVIYNRNESLKSGIYLVKITDLTTGKTEIRKILFQ